MSEGIWNQLEIINWTQLLLDSYEKLLGNSLIERNCSMEEQAKILFFAPFVVVSHGTQSDPIFNYANEKAQELWEMSWQDFIITPSRKSAEFHNTENREKMLKQVAQLGYLDNYEGIRISSTGKKFRISKVVIWNLTNYENQYLGQAATFSNWCFL